MNIWLFLGLLLIISVFLTFLIRSIAIKRNVVDIPNERSSHTISTPRGGGLAIVIIWFGALGLLYLNGKIPDNLFFALLSGLLLATVSLLDDIFSLQPLFRLPFQIISASLALFFLNGFETSLFTEIKTLDFLIYPVIIVGIVWFINLFNFLDGIDGYASLEAIFVAISLFIFTGELLTLVLIASVAGFLFWNWPKAKIFMGDVGSTQLGYILIVLGIYFHNNDGPNFSVWIILSSLFWFDATLTLYRRWRNNEKLSKAHRKHIYQRAVQAGFSHLITDLYALAINLVIFILAYIAYCKPQLSLPILIVNVLFLFVVAKSIDKRYPFDYKNEQAEK